MKWLYDPSNWIKTQIKVWAFINRVNTECTSLCLCRNALPDVYSDPPGCSQREALNHSAGWWGPDLSQTRGGHHRRFAQRSGSSCVPEVALLLHSGGGRAAGDLCWDGGGHEPSRWVSVLHPESESGSYHRWVWEKSDQVEISLRYQLKVMDSSLNTAEEVLAVSDTVDSCSLCPPTTGVWRMLTEV